MFSALILEITVRINALNIYSFIRYRKLNITGYLIRAINAQYANFSNCVRIKALLIYISNKAPVGRNFRYSSSVSVSKVSSFCNCVEKTIGA